MLPNGRNWQKMPTDKFSFDVYIDQPGDYQLILEYNCSSENAMQEGQLDFNSERFYFRTLTTGGFDNHQPMIFIKQRVTTTYIKDKGRYKIWIEPQQNGKELFNLKAVYLNPVK